MADNLRTALANLCSAEVHFEERVAVSPKGSQEERDAQLLLDDVRALRQMMTEFEGDEQVWCGYRHILVTYTNSLEEIAKRARSRAPLLNVGKSVKYIYKVLDRIEAFAKKYPGDGPNSSEKKPKKVH